MYNILNEYQINLIFRILISCICGIAIGIERKNRAKGAGMRTHCIVACASAMMMIVSKYGFSDIMEGYDPSRVASSIVSGVGFIGAGIIYVQRCSIKGLTTAAGIWATSGIGMAIGSGMYIIGISGTLLLLVIQIVLHAGTRFMVSHKSKIIKIYEVNKPDFQEQTTRILKEMGVTVNDVGIKRRSDGLYDYAFYCEITSGVSEEYIIKKFDNECIIDVMV